MVREATLIRTCYKDRVPGKKTSASSGSTPLSSSSPSPSGTSVASTRWPWLRSLSYSLIVALSPAVWVIETQSCSGEAGASGTTRELTGSQLFSELSIESPFDAAWIGTILCLMLAAPFLAYYARTPLLRVGLHVVGLLGAAFGTLSTFTLVMFVIFATRMVRPAGFLVLVLGTLPLIEGLVRLVLGGRELVAARRALASPSGNAPAPEPEEPEEPQEKTDSAPVSETTEEREDG